MSRLLGCVLGAAGLVAVGVAAAPARARAEDPERAIDLVRIQRGAYLGELLEDAQDRGATVKQVEADSPAARAGLKQGDLIVRFDGESVRSVAQLVRLVRETPPGRSVALEVTRGGAAQRLQATLEEGKGRRFLAEGEIPDVWELLRPPEAPAAPEAPQAPRAPRVPRGPDLRLFGEHAPGFSFDNFEHFFSFGPRKLGIRYQEISGQLARYFKLSGDRGVLVTEVDADSPAAKAGIQAGDVILKLGGRSIADGDDLRDALEEKQAGQEVPVTVQREGRALDLEVTLAGSKEKRRGLST
jgi:S1-C subfamily serine protease